MQRSKRGREEPGPCSPGKTSPSDKEESSNESRAKIRKNRKSEAYEKIRPASGPVLLEISENVPGTSAAASPPSACAKKSPQCKQRVLKGCEGRIGTPQVDNLDDIIGVAKGGAMASSDQTTPPRPIGRGRGRRSSDKQDPPEGNTPSIPPVSSPQPPCTENVKFDRPIYELNMPILAYYKDHVAKTSAKLRYSAHFIVRKMGETMSVIQFLDFCTISNIKMMAKMIRRIVIQGESPAFLSTYNMQYDGYSQEQILQIYSYLPIALEFGKRKDQVVEFVTWMQKNAIKTTDREKGKSKAAFAPYRPPTSSPTANVPPPPKCPTQSPTANVPPPPKCPTQSPTANVPPPPKCPTQSPTANVPPPPRCTTRSQTAKVATPPKCPTPSPTASAPPSPKSPKASPTVKFSSPPMCPPNTPAVNVPSSPKSPKASPTAKLPSPPTLLRRIRDKDVEAIIDCVNNEESLQFIMMGLSRAYRSQLSKFGEETNQANIVSEFSTSTKMGHIFDTFGFVENPGTLAAELFPDRSTAELPKISLQDTPVTSGILDPKIATEILEEFVVRMEVLRPGTGDGHLTCLSDDKELSSVLLSLISSRVEQVLKDQAVKQSEENKKEGSQSENQAENEELKEARKLAKTNQIFRALIPSLDEYFRILAKNRHLRLDPFMLLYIYTVYKEFAVCFVKMADQQPAPDNLTDRLNKLRADQKAAPSNDYSSKRSRDKRIAYFRERVMRHVSSLGLSRNESLTTLYLIMKEASRQGYISKMEVTELTDHMIRDGTGTGGILTREEVLEHKKDVAKMGGRESLHPMQPIMNLNELSRDAVWKSSLLRIDTEEASDALNGWMRNCAQRFTATGRTLVARCMKFAATPNSKCPLTELMMLNYLDDSGPAMKALRSLFEAYLNRASHYSICHHSERCVSSVCSVPGALDFEVHPPVGMYENTTKSNIVSNNRTVGSENVVIGRRGPTGGDVPKIITSISYRANVSDPTAPIEFQLAKMKYVNNMNFKLQLENIKQFSCELKDAGVKIKEYIMDHDAKGSSNGDSVVISSRDSYTVILVDAIRMQLKMADKAKDVKVYCYNDRLAMPFNDNDKGKQINLEYEHLVNGAECHLAENHYISFVHLSGLLSVALLLDGVDWQKEETFELVKCLKIHSWYSTIQADFWPMMVRSLQYAVYGKMASLRPGICHLLDSPDLRVLLQFATGMGPSDANILLASMCPGGAKISSRLELKTLLRNVFGEYETLPTRMFENLQRSVSIDWCTGRHAEQFADYLPIKLDDYVMAEAMFKKLYGKLAPYIRNNQVEGWKAQSALITACKSSIGKFMLNDAEAMIVKLHNSKDLDLQAEFKDFAIKSCNMGSSSLTELIKKRLLWILNMKPLDKNQHIVLSNYDFSLKSGVQQFILHHVICPHACDVFKVIMHDDELCKRYALNQFGSYTIIKQDVEKMENEANRKAAAVGKDGKPTQSLMAWNQSNEVKRYAEDAAYVARAAKYEVPGKHGRFSKKDGVSRSTLLVTDLEYLEFWAAGGVISFKHGLHDYGTRMSFDFLSLPEEIEFEMIRKESSFTSAGSGGKTKTSKSIVEIESKAAYILSTNVGHPAGNLSMSMGDLPMHHTPPILRYRGTSSTNILDSSLINW